MLKLLTYRTRTTFLSNLSLLEKEFPGLANFSYYFKVYTSDVTAFDRTGVIKFPINLINKYPLPDLVPFTKDYESICNERAKELWKKSDDLHLPINVMYSGGIDSTLVVISLLKNATEQQRQKLVILLSEDSIIENPNFYENFILGKIATKPAHIFPYLLGKRDQIIVIGEHNDQVFGSDIIGSYMRLNGDQEAFRDYSRDNIVSFFNNINNDPKMNNYLFDHFDRLCKAAPVKIKTVYDFFWWINFTCKWNCVQYRSVLYTSEANRGLIDNEYLDTYYFSFYNTVDFQLWSMTNMDKKIKNTWKTYKYPAKEIIFKYNNDKEYFDNKTKVASLPRVVVDFSPSKLLDEGGHLLEDVDFKEIYNSDNDFK